MPVLLATVLLVFLSCCKSPTPASEVQEGTTSAPIRKFFEDFGVRVSDPLSFEEAFPNQISSRTNVFSIDALDWASLSGNYAYQVDKADKGVYLRTDKWRIGANVSIGDVINLTARQSLPVTLGFSPNHEIEFVRVFDNRKQAMTAVPSMPWQMPVSAKTALELKTGDFVSMPVSMGINLGVSSRSTTAEVGAYVETGLFWVGEFRINIYRHRDQLVRLKISPSREVGVYATVGSQLELHAFGYDPSGLINLDNQVERLLGLNFFRLSSQRIWASERFTWDYIFDLSHAESVQAFDQMLGRPLRYTKEFRRIVPKEWADLGVLDLGYTEKLVAEDGNQPTGKRRIERMISGRSLGSGISSSSRLGTALLKWTKDRSVMIHKIQASEVDVARQDRFLYPIYRNNRRTSSWLEPLRAQDRIHITSAIEMDDSQPVATALSFVYGRNLHQRRLNALEGNKIRADVAALFGLNRFDHLLKEYLPNGLKTYDDFRLDLTMGWDDAIFTGWGEIGKASPERFRKTLWQVIDDISKQVRLRSGAGSAAAPSNPLLIPEFVWSQSIQMVEKTVRSAIQLRWDGIQGKIATDLVDATANLSKIGPANFVLKLMEILSTDLSAEEIIPAFLFKLCEKLDSKCYAEVKTSRNGIEEKKFSRGTLQNVNLQDDLAEKFRLITHMGFELSDADQP
jgi:hypothetical protein